jgi:hypothetical protein
MPSNTQRFGIDPADALRAPRFNPWPMLIGTAFACGAVGGIVAYLLGA